MSKSKPSFLLKQKIGGDVGFPLYAMMMFYYHWLIKKLLWAYGFTEENKWKLQAEIEEKRRQNQGDAM